MKGTYNRKLFDFCKRVLTIEAASTENSEYAHGIFNEIENLSTRFLQGERSCIRDSEYFFLKILFRLKDKESTS